MIQVERIVIGKMQKPEDWAVSLYGIDTDTVEEYFREAAFKSFPRALEFARDLCNKLNYDQNKIQITWWTQPQWVHTE